MARIIKVVGVDNRGEYAIVHVILDDGEEASVMVGGEVEVWFNKGVIRAFVKKKSS